MRTKFGLIIAIGLVFALGAWAPAPAEPAPAVKEKPAPAKAAAVTKPAVSKPTGKLTYGTPMLATTENWFPWLEGRVGFAVMHAFYEALVAFDTRSGNFVPMLAERWQVEDRGKRWRFFLRRGVQFHDGWGELTAEDVKYTVERYITDEKAIAASSAAFKRLLERFEIVSPYEFVLHLKEPSVTLLGHLSPTYFLIVSKRYLESAGDRIAMAKPVGTGPFKLVDHQRAQSVTLEAVVPHWRQTPSFKILEIRQIPDDAARLAMLRAREIDVMAVPFKFKRELQAAGFSFLRLKSAALYHIHLGGQVLPTRKTFDPQVPWVGDPTDPASLERARKVRRALNLAVDKQAIIDSVFEGEGIRLSAAFLPPGSEFVPQGQTPYPYDPAQARRLLAEAGYAQGFAREIEMHLMPWPGRAEMVDVGEAVAGFWERNLGLKVKRTPIDFATWAPRVNLPRNTAWRSVAQGYNPPPLAEPAISMATWLLSTGARNTVAETQELDKLFAAVIAESDRAKRVQLYRQLWQRLYGEYYAVPIAAVPALYAYDPKVVANWPMPPGDAYATGFEHAVRAGK